MESPQLRRSQIAEGTFKDLWDDGLRLVFEGVIGFEQLEKELRPYLSDRVGAPKNRHEKAGIRPIREASTSSLVAQL
jgi:general secretion pathway protein E